MAELHVTSCDLVVAWSRWLFDSTHDCRLTALIAKRWSAASWKAMGTFKVPRGGQPKRARIPRWTSPVLWGVGILLGHGVIPWAISLLSSRHGWLDEHPGVWNLMALILVAAGTSGIIWCLGLHFVQLPQAVLMERIPTYLLARGLYKFTRNPMYLSVFAIWLGWTLFYGSFSVLIGFLIFAALLTFYNVPREERDLEARFGEVYLRYKNAVPRWLGKTRP